jgi:hypothetical protein
LSPNCGEIGDPELEEDDPSSGDCFGDGKLVGAFKDSENRDVDGDLLVI